MAIGIMLDIFAVNWLIGIREKGYLYALAGIGIAITINHFGLKRLVDKNLGRIKAMKGKVSVFTFMPWRSYLIVPVMIFGGIMLRHSSIERRWLSIGYLGMGTALILSGIKYFTYFALYRKGNDKTPRGQAS